VLFPIAQEILQHRQVCQKLNRGPRQIFHHDRRHQFAPRWISARRFVPSAYRSSYHRSARTVSNQYSIPPPPFESCRSWACDNRTLFLMMRAKVNPVNESVFPAQQRFQLVMNFLQFNLVAKSFGDHGLVRHHDRPPALQIQFMQRLGNTR
jgi:hypothetical protein